MKLGFDWKQIVLAVALTPAVVLTGCQSDGGETGLVLAEPVTIHQQYSGSSDTLKSAGTYLVTSQSQWDAAGYGDVIPGPMDFRTHDVVVVAMGEQRSGGFWVHIDAIQKVGTELAVQCTLNAPGEDDAATAVVTYPYHAVAIPKTGATLAVPDPTFVTSQPQPESQLP